MVRLTDRPDMTLDVYRGRKTTTNNNLKARTKKKKKKMDDQKNFFKTKLQKSFIQAVSYSKFKDSRANTVNLDVEAS